MSSPRPWVAPKSSPTTAPTNASPKLVWRLATIHESADGIRISVVSWRSLAPRMRALAMRLRSTSRTPWNALKNTTKKTSTAAAERNAEDDAQDRPDDEAADGLLHRDQDLLPKRSEVGSLRDPEPELGGDRGRLRPEEDVDPTKPRRELPASEDDDADQDAEPVHGQPH